MPEGKGEVESCQEFGFFLCFLLSGLVIIYADKITIFVTTFLNTFLF